jgi:hypothetical protein
MPDYGLGLKKKVIILGGVAVLFVSNCSERGGIPTP